MRVRKRLGRTVEAGFTLAGTLMGFETLDRIRVRTYRPRPANWPVDLGLRIVAISDLHVCRPWMGVSRIRHICERINALEPDIVLMLGDFVTAMPRLARAVPFGKWVPEFARLRAPLGVHAVLGNHDWQEDPVAQARGSGPVEVGLALADAGVRVYENHALQLQKGGAPFWLAGLSDQHALRIRGQRPHNPHAGLHDLAGTLAHVTDAAPILLMAHEPDIFTEVPDRVSLTLSGHTHGGQVRLFGRTPVVPSRYGSRFVHGHIVEEGRHLIVSAGLGCSGLPIRLGVRPEMLVVELGGRAAGQAH